MKAALTLMTLTCGAIASAGPTGLNWMPTVDVLKHREIAISYSVSGTEPSIDKRYLHANSVLLGVADRIELGYDNGFDGQTTLNAKVLLIEDCKALPHVGLSAGLTGVNGNEREPYVVARYDFKKMRLHGGYWRTAGVNRAMFGVDFAVFGDSTAMAEHITGGGGYSWAGLSIPVRGLPGLSLNVSVGLPNTKSDGIQHYGMLFYSVKL